MSDFNSSLPIRTENNGDVVAQLVDGTVTSQKLSIDASGKIPAKLSDGAGNAITSQANGGQQALDVGVNVGGVQVDPRSIRALTSSDVVTADQGTAAALAGGWPVIPTDGTNSQSYTASGEAKVDITVALPAGSNIIGKVDILDASGNPFTETNPLPVSVAESSGTRVNDYATVASVASSASSNHDYTVTAGKTLFLTQIECAASGKLKAEIRLETAAGSGTFNTKFVGFNSTAHPCISFILKEPIAQVAGAKVRVVLTNDDNQAQDVYSTICGHEV